MEDPLVDIVVSQAETGALPHRLEGASPLSIKIASTSILIRRHTDDDSVSQPSDGKAFVQASHFRCAHARLVVILYTICIA